MLTGVFSLEHAKAMLAQAFTYRLLESQAQADKMSREFGL